MLLLQLTVLLVALSGETVALSVATSPSVRLRLVLSSVTPVTAITFADTVTEQVAVLSPAFAVIVALPAFTAVTLPPASTVATAVLLLLQLTVLLAALSGFTVAVSVALSPSVSESVALSSFTDSTGTGLPSCRTVKEADFPALLMVTLAVRSSTVPFAWAVTCKVTSPAFPEEGEKETHPGTLASETAATQESGAVKDTVLVCGPV